MSYWIGFSSYPYHACQGKVSDPHMHSQQLFPPQHLRYAPFMAPGYLPNSHRLNASLYEPDFSMPFLALDRKGKKIFQVSTIISSSMAISSSGIWSKPEPPEPFWPSFFFFQSKYSRVSPSLRLASWTRSRTVST